MAWLLLLFLETLIKACYWLGYKSPSLVSSKWSYVASFTAKVIAISSVSVDNNTTMACFFKHQLTGPLLSMKMKLKVNLWLFLLPA